MSVERRYVWLMRALSFVFVQAERWLPATGHYSYRSFLRYGEALSELLQDRAP